MSDDERERIQAETVRAIVDRMREAARWFVVEARVAEPGHVAKSAALFEEADRLERDWRAIVRGSR